MYRFRIGMFPFTHHLYWLQSDITYTNQIGDIKEKYANISNVNCELYGKTRLTTFLLLRSTGKM